MYVDGVNVTLTELEAGVGREDTYDKPDAGQEGLMHGWVTGVSQGARARVLVIVVSNSTGVKRPGRLWRRRRW